MRTVDKKKMLYIMGTDWDWIYQRPQVIAEYLSRDYDVTVAYPVKFWDRQVVKGCDKKDVETHKLGLWVFPFQRKNKLISALGDKYRRFRLRNYKQYKYIYIDYPINIDYILKNYKGCLIYDCIDDHEQMCTNEYMRRRVNKAEAVLMQRSDLVIVSSKKLLQKKEHAYRKKVNLVRNGTSYTKVFNVKGILKKRHYMIGYIGTIAEWFDHDLIEQSAQMHTEVEYHLIGPCMRSGQATQGRIIYDGVVEHAKLHLHVKDYDCLIMPFKVNEIVEAVDPVKLYEYIAFGKCIISIYYKELDYFKDYVYFYRTEAEYDDLLDKLINDGFPPKYDEQQQEQFLRENSWEERYLMIHRLIEQLAGESVNE